MNNKLLFYDATLRDGSHANEHSFNVEFCRRYITKAYEAGLRHIEVGHGNGLGGSSLHIGIHQDQGIWQCVAALKDEYPDLNVGVHVIPGLATFEDIDAAIASGVSIFRVASHCSEADTTESYIEYAIRKGGEVWGMLMMAHMVKPDRLAREAKKMEIYGASRIIFLDSAGALTPSKVTCITEEMTRTLDSPIGFHAHNNLHAAVANSLAAIQGGCTSVDCCISGYGAGAGNLCLEAFIAILEKDGLSTGLSLTRLVELASILETQFASSLPKVDSISVATGFYGVFSGFKYKILEAARSFNVPPTDIITCLGKEQIIAGQEDQIFSVASRLSDLNKKSL